MKKKVARMERNRKIKIEKVENKKEKRTEITTCKIN